MEYAFQGLVYGEKKYWAAGYPRLGDARRAAKIWVDKTPSRTASLMQKQPRPSHHDIGATWEEVGFVKWTT